MGKYLYHLYSRLAHFLQVGVRIVTRYVTAHVRNVQKQYYAIIFGLTRNQVSLSWCVLQQNAHPEVTGLGRGKTATKATPDKGKSKNPASRQVAGDVEGASFATSSNHALSNCLCMRSIALNNQSPPFDRPLRQWFLTRMLHLPCATLLPLCPVILLLDVLDLNSASIQLFSFSSLMHIIKYTMLY